jgi:hypothetical protein
MDPFRCAARLRCVPERPLMNLFSRSILTGGIFQIKYGQSTVIRTLHLLCVAAFTAAFFFGVRCPLFPYELESTP